jgi:hypothetical protein
MKRAQRILKEQNQMVNTMTHNPQFHKYMSTEERKLQLNPPKAIILEKRGKVLAKSPNAT